MVAGLVDVELNERVDACAAFQNLLRVQRGEIEAQVSQARKVVQVGFRLGIGCWSLLVARRRRLLDAVIDFLLTAVARLIQSNQIWFAANGNDVFVEDVKQRVGIYCRVRVEKIAARLLGFQVPDRPDLR